MLLEQTDILTFLILSGGHFGIEDGRYKFDQITCVPLFSERELSTVILCQVSHFYHILNDFYPKLLDYVRECMLCCELSPSLTVDVLLL